MNMITAATNMDVEGWLRGLFSAGISSFAGAIAGAGGPAIMDPKDFNLTNPMLMLKTAFAGAALCGIVSIAKYLSISPLPAVKVITTTTETTQPPTKKDPTTVVTTVEEKHVEPLKPNAPDK